MKSANKHTFKKRIGALIRKHRVSKGLSMQDLADLLQTDRQYIWRIENGRINISLDYLDKIILKLKCEHDDFIKE